jgi:hypothetical protein
MSVARVSVSAIALALLMQASMPPNAATPCSTAARTCCSSRMSQTIGSVLPPAATTSSAALKIVPGSFGCGSAVLAARTKFAPSFASRRGDGQADAATRPRDEDRLAPERHGASPVLAERRPHRM